MYFLGSICKSFQLLSVFFSLVRYSNILFMQILDTILLIITVKFFVSCISSVAKLCLQVYDDFTDYVDISCCEYNGYILSKWLLYIISLHSNDTCLHND